MQLTKSVAGGLGILALGIGLAACADNEEPAPPPSIESTAAPGSTTSTPSEPTADEYRVALEVGYRQTLRFPGSGHIPRELEFNYVIDTSASIGTMAETAAEGTAAWAIRCYSDETVADPEASPSDERAGNPPLATGTADSQFLNPAALEPEVDWLAGPGVLLLEQGEALTVAHRLPSSVGLGEAVELECTGSVSALTVDWGHGAMTAPARVNISGTDYTRAEALNLEQQPPVYVLDESGDGWMLMVIPLDDLGSGPQEIAFLREESEPEGEQRLEVAGTIERNRS